MKKGENDMNLNVNPQMPLNVQPVQFASFSNDTTSRTQPEKINLIKEVPLEISVELGRTNKMLSEVLDFAPGKVVELNKLAGEPVDVLVNGKLVAKGEIVVIEETFGVRVLEIVNRSALPKK